MSTRQAVVTKFIRLAPEERQMLKRISEAESLSEAALMRQFVLRGMDRYRLEQPIAEVRRGSDDERVLRSQLQCAAETAFARLWDNEGDEIWNEYL